MSRRPSRRVLIAAAVAGVLVVAALGVVAWRHFTTPTGLAARVQLAPAGTVRISYTDWADVRRLTGLHTTLDSPPSEVQRMLDVAFDRDYSSPSTLTDSDTATLINSFGFSPGSIDYELYAQSYKGAVDIMGLPDTAAYDRIEQRLAASGFIRPSRSDGVWLGGPDLVTRLAGNITPELQYVALLSDEHLLLTSDSATYLQTAVAAAEGHGPRVSGLGDVVAATGQPVAAAIYSGDYTCTALAMAHADSEDQDQGSKLIAAAGKVTPLTGFSLSMQPDGHDRIVLGFEDSRQARENADARATLASGPAPGQGGSFTDRFRLLSTVADGNHITMDLQPQPHQYVLSDLSTGPLLLATC